MVTIAIIIFIAGYIAISLEHPIGINKAATAVLTGVLCWTVYALQLNDPGIVAESLMHHLGEISSILFFLLGAMTIGVAAMGIAKIEFMWYLKRIGWIAFLGFIAGVGAYMAQELIF